MPKLQSANLPVEAAWNTWSERPAEMVFLPLGVRVTSVIYSSKLRKATTIRPPAGIRFGAHGLDGEQVAFETEHGGTRLGFHYTKPDPFSIVGGWHAVERGEWGLRHWVMVCLSAEGGETVRFSVEEGVATVAVGTRHVALLSDAAAVEVTGHDSIEALCAHMDAHGYFEISARTTEAPVLALRFNLEMMAENRFAAAVADSRALAIAGARAALREMKPEPAPLQAGRHPGALDVVRDVLGWNTLFDRINGRRYTAVSRIWNLGDFAVWFNDQCFAALMAGMFDAGLARDNLAAALASQTPQGNFACLVTSRDAWVDRTQAAHGAFIVWTMFLRTCDRSLLEAAYAPLARNHRWWRENRDPEGTGLVSCGTSDVGEGLYKGTAFGARNETGMDNSATHDEAVYDPETRTLSTWDVGLNAALGLDAEMLACIATELGHAEEAGAWSALAADTREKIGTQLWDEERGLFANRQRHGGFVRSVGPTSFFPLLCGAASERQIARLLGHLEDPKTFGGEWVLPNATRDDPAYRDNTYWRGRIWPNVNYLVWQGLRRSGREAEAQMLADKSMTLFEKEWSASRLCGENYSAETGEVVDAPDTDPFYTWGAMLPLMGVAALMDIGPWHGWEITNPGKPARLGPVASPVGMVVVSVDEEGVLALSTTEGMELWETNLRGPLRHIISERGLLSMVLPERLGADNFVRLGESIAPRVVSARVDGVAIETGGLLLALPVGPAGARLDVHLALVL